MLGDEIPKKVSMVFIRPALTVEPPPILRGDGVVLRPPVQSDYQAWADLRGASRPELTGFEPRWAEDELSRAAFRARLKRYQQDARTDAGYAFFVFDAGARRLVGGMTLSTVRRGVAQAATVGYWIGTAETGRGLATAALGRLLRHAFDDLGLHRVEAACMPRNLASLRVLGKCGFEREGLGRRYLRIDGRWEDHILLARVGGDDG